nr:putative reverse transcriptase domain-containing protein [Tanacetum cinerariifolium]
MVIKSALEEDMLLDIQETFDRLRSINMKLNPKNCSFDVEEGPFLGYLITKHGIKSNSSKIKAIIDLKPPKMLKEIQSLNGKPATLSQFLSNDAHKKMKEFIEILLTLTAPIKVKVLVMYLTTLAESISAVLLAEREKRQVPIYLVSRVLQGAELNYPELEKLILALVHAARRLRRYFQAHTIRVLTNKPTKKILARPKKLGRLAKWAIELGKHDIKLKG